MFPRSKNSSGFKRKSSLATLVDQSTVLLMVAIGALILILALMILFHENANATKGYRLRTLELERGQLLLEEEVLKMQIAQQQAIEELQDDPAIQSMQPVKNAIYVNGSGL
jgi:hypothetical protein